MANPNPSPATRWKKGQSGNIKGKRPLSPELKAIQELQADELKAMMAKFARMRVCDLEAYLRSQEIIGIEKTIILNILNPGALPFVMDRTIGKEPDKTENINLNIDAEDDEYREIPKETLLKVVGES